MKYLTIFIQVILIFFFLLLGEYVKGILHLPISGSIVGMILLFLSLNFRILPKSWVVHGATFLIKILPLLFVPSLVGVINFPSLFSPLGALLLFIIIFSTILGMVTAGWTSQLLEKRGKKGEQKKEWNNYSKQSL